MRTRTASAALIGGVLLATAGGSLAVTSAASAHTPELSCTGSTIVVDLRDYPAGSTVSGRIDDVDLGTTTFGPDSFHAEQSIDTSVEHTYAISVVGSDGQGSHDWTGRTSELCGVPISTPTEEPTGTPTPTPPVETPVPTGTPTPTAPPTEEPTAPPMTTPPTGEPTTPAPSDGPTSAPTPSAPITVPTPTDGTTPPASTPTVPSLGVPSPDSHSTSPSSAPSTASAVPVAADTSGPDTLAYTGANGPEIAGIGVGALGLAAAGAAVMVIRRNRRRATEEN